MWLLSWPWPNEARIRLPPERKVLPWHHRPADTARTAELLAGMILGVDRHAILPWPAVEALAKRPDPGRWERTLLVAVATAPDLPVERVDQLLGALGAAHVVAQLPEPADDGHGWQERAVKPALLRRSQMELAAPDHALSSLGIQNVPLRKVAALSTDALDFVDLAEAAVGHRLERTAEGMSEQDYLRSVWWAAGRMVADRLLRLPPDTVRPALSVLLSGRVDRRAEEQERAAARGLQAVGLARVVSTDVSVGPLGRAVAEQPEVLAALRERIPELPGETASSRRRGVAAWNPELAEEAAPPPTQELGLEAMHEDAENATPPDAEPTTREIGMARPPEAVLRVEEVLRLHGRAAARRAAPPPFGAHLQVQSSDDFNLEPWAALRGDVDMTLLLAFQRDIDAPYRVLDPTLVSTLVHEGQIVSKEVEERARAGRVRLVRFADLQRSLLDLGPYLEDQTRRLENDPLYPPRLYVDQRIVFSTAGQETRHERGIEALSEVLSDDKGRFVLVLGDFGTGKTFLLHELARRMALAGGHVAPILVNLRELEKTHSLDALLGQHFGAARVPFDALVFRYLLREGRMALLFDGFDELALRVRYDRATAHLETLLQAAEGRARVVVTSRTQHFLSDRQVKSALYRRVDSADRRAIARLLPFDREQMASFLVRRLGEAEGAERRLELIEQVKDLAGLSENPRMLSFIASLPEEDLLRARDRKGQISAASLYQRLIERWFEQEEERAGTNKGALPGLTTGERWRAVEHLALSLWGRTENTVSAADLPAAVASALEELSAHDLDHEAAAHQVGSSTLLVRDAEGQFSFLHQSVLEWLVASAAARALSRGEDPAMLRSGAMSALMAELFVDLASPSEALRWAEEVTRGAASDAAKRNALTVLKRLGVDVIPRADYRGKDLRGQDFSGQDLRNADFTGADLTDARLVGTKLQWAILRRAVLRGADIEGADFSGADLTSADLRGTQGRAVMRSVIIDDLLF
jgi:hypothetical protein